MGCCKPKTFSPPRSESRKGDHKEEIFLQIPGASAHLMAEGETVELARGDLVVLGITEEGVILSTVVKIGPDLRWPLTRDEPVVKLDELHYLFSLPAKDGGFLNYGVSFAGPDTRLASLDSFLDENACFSASANPSSLHGRSSSGGAYWSGLAPKVGDYNGLLAKAIAGGTGEIVKGIFTCSNIYASQVQKGADLIRLQANDNKPSSFVGENKGDAKAATVKKRGSINKSIRRVRKLSEMTEKLSRSLLNGVISVSGSVATPMVRSKAGKALLASVPGEVLLVSLDAVNRVVDAVEAAERKALAATGEAAAGMVSQRFGEGAGEATGDVFATAGHTVGTAWNIFKIRKAITPSSSVSSSILKNAVKKKT